MNPLSLYPSIKSLLINLNRAILIVIAILISTFTIKAQVAATLTPTSNFGGCNDSVFTYFYSNASSAHSHNLRVTASLLNDSIACGSGTGIPLRMINLSSSAHVTFVSASATGDTLIYHVDSIATSDTIRFKTHVDCSNLTFNNQNDLYLRQTFTDLSGGYIFNVNGNPNNIVQQPISYIKIVSNIYNNNIFYYHTNDTSFFQFPYYNISQIDAHVRFNFHTSDSTFCGTGVTHYYKYSTDSINYTLFTPNTNVLVTIPSLTTLYIRQYATQTHCLPDTFQCQPFAYFSYQCAFTDSGYCTACYKKDSLQYRIMSNDRPSLIMTDLTPALKDSDYSCFNDSIERIFRFVYNPSSFGILDSVHILIANYNNATILSPPALNLIKKESVKLSCSSCVINDTTFSPNNFALCGADIPHPITSFNATITAFHRTDTLILKFKTYRCSEDNDTELLNHAKSLNQWQVTHNDYTVCIHPDSTTNVTVDISSESTGANGGHNIEQLLEFYPTNNSLVVPHGSLFGDSLKLTVDLKGITTNGYEKFQYLHCNGIPGCQPEGLIRARIFVDTGLHVTDYTSAYFQVDTGISPNVAPYYITAVYHNTSIPDTACEKGYYYFYYNLSDTLFRALREGKFNYTVRACCPDTGKNAEPCKVGVSFYIMPDVNNCFTDSFPNDHITPPIISNSNGVGAFLPLSSSNFQMHIRCPNCRAPGCIADSYKIRRISYGLQESNILNYIADTNLTQITDTSAWFAAHKNQLALNHSSFGDKLQDFLIAHFQDGDNQDTMDPGYTYSQMKHDGAYLRYLQIAAVIPGYKKHGLTPYSFDFYVDDTTYTGSADTCIDCALLGASTSYRTLLHISIPDSLISNYLKIDTASGTYFTTFTMMKDSAYYLLDTTKVQIKYQSPTLPFDSFEVDQRYRLTIKYNECNNFSTPVNATLDSVTKPTEINLRTWFSGTYKPFNAYDNNPPMPNTMSALHSADWQFSNETDTFNYVNQNFANYFIWFCEANGTLHYFFSQDAGISSKFYNIDTTCNILMLSQISTSIARNLANVYPWEYRPPTLFPTSYTFQIPAGYSIDSIKNYNPISGFIKLTIPYLIGGYYHIPYDSLPKPACSHEAMIPVNTYQYLSSRANSTSLYIYLNPLSCSDSAFLNMDSALFATIDTVSLSCLHLSDCAMYDTLRNGNYYSKAMSFANLQVGYAPSLPLLANSSHLCWQTTFTNPLVDHGYFTNNGITTISAPHVYLQLPDTSFLNNFTFTIGTNPSIAAVSGIINVAANLTGGGTLTGMLCADYIHCAPDSFTLPVTAGYDCKNFPDTPFVDSSACYTLHDTLKILNQAADLFTGNAPSPIYYPLCTPFTIPVQYHTANLGVVYPDSITFDSIQGLTIQNIRIKKCSAADTLYKTLQPTGISHHWFVTQQQLDSLAFDYGGISLPQTNNGSNCLEFLFSVQADCKFSASNLDSVITFYTHNFCNDTIIRKTSLNNFIYNDTNNCTTCFTITKTVDKNPVNALDTVTYSIIVCANNGSPQSVHLEDILPATNFVLTSNALDTFPNIVAQGCDTFKITGYFQYADSCPNTTDTARLVFGVTPDTIFKTLCNTVNEPCYSPSYTFIADSTFASSLPDSISNDTLIIAGRFYIDANLTLSHCLVYAYPGANIIVINSMTMLTLDSTNIIGCSQMWRGIYLEDAGTTIFARHSTIADAENGIWARSYNFVYVDSCSIKNCITGINLSIPNLINLGATDTATAGYIRGTSIGKTGNYKPFFINQSDTDTLHTTAIEMQNKNFNIGNNSTAKNYLHHAYYGVKAINSVSYIRNTQFEQIKPQIAEAHATSSGVYAIGNPNEASSYILVFPLADYTLPTVKNCRMGVYSKYTDINVSGTTMTGVQIGVQVDSTSNLKTAFVNNNTISAKRRGINFNSNAGAFYCTASDNYIYMDGNIAGRGINVNEKYTMANSHYYIGYNHIFMANASEGIRVHNANQTIVQHNIVRMASSNDTLRTGISMINCDYSTSICNQVTGSNPADTNQIGMSTKISTAPNIICNAVDSTGWGVYFEGTNIATDFSTTSMTNNNEGLHLNSTGDIGTQSNKGNQFAGPFYSPYGAVDNNPGLSQFLVDTNDGPFLMPNISTIINSGWFKEDSTGITTFCSQNLYCNMTIIAAVSMDSLMERIVADSAVSTEFIEESKLIAQEKLFDYLMDDSDRYYANTVLTNFVLSNIDSTLSDIYIVEKQIANCFNRDEESTRTITYIDTVITNLIAEINMYDSTGEYERRSLCIDSLNEQVALRNHYTDSLNSYNYDYLDRARYLLTTIEFHGEPDDNKLRVLTDIIRMMQEHTPLEDIEGELTEIANKCPSSGGPAVYIARAALEEKYDTLMYDDRTTCAYEGYFRMMIKNDAKINLKGILLIPNPATFFVNIRIVNEGDLISDIEVLNNVGSKVFRKNSITQKSFPLNISSFANGVYTIRVKTTNGFYFTSKLIVIR